MVVDAFVEVTGNGEHWMAAADPRDGLYGVGPWSVPHATEVARCVWSRLVRMGLTSMPHRSAVRVIDAAGTLVEQWPKRA